MRRARRRAGPSRRDLAALRRHVARAKRAAPARWNADPDDVPRSVARLVLSLVELLRRLLERQALHRLERGTLSSEETERVGLGLMRLEETVREIAERFGLALDDLDLDLGPLGRLW